MLPTTSENGVAVTAPEQCSNGHVLRVILIGLFFFALLPVIPSPSKFHGDERFYTDAALQMIQTGDYWTPVYPDGSIRLLKPILTYWTAVSSLRLFGVSLFSARLPFLLASLLVLGLTWQLARTIFNSNRTALLAALILASNVELLTLSTRATPDVLVCLFILLSMWGFSRVWFAGDRSFVGPLLAFGGMGLAVQTKGLLGLAPVAANLLFWLLVRPGNVRLKSFLHWPAIIVGIALGGFWYAVMLWRHGPVALQDFYADQVGAKVARNPGFVFSNLALYLFAIVRHFLPWTLLLLAALIWGRRELAGFWKNHRNQVVFLLGLSAVLVVVFSLGNMRRARYLTASYPMLAVLLAGMFSGFYSGQGPQRWLRRFVGATAVLIFLSGAFLLFAGGGSDWRLAAGGGALAGLGIAGLLATRSQGETGRWIWISGTVVVLFAFIGACIRPVFSPSPLALAADSIGQTSSGNNTVYLWGLDDTSAAQFRLLTRGKVRVKLLPEKDGPPEFAPACAVMTTATNRQILERAGYQLNEMIPTNPALTNSWLGRLALKKADQAHQGPRQSFWIAVKPSSQGDDRRPAGEVRLRNQSAK
jgi:4-amino-4-deoxy-L-arabinose transferase-like glycosyltransferase